MCCRSSASPRTITRGADAFHGAGGELRVEMQRLRWPILDAFREAAEEIGVPKIDDFNSGDNDGSAYFEVNQRSGLRLSAARAFLRPVRHRPNLRVLTGAQAERILIEDGRACRPRATGSDGRPRGDAPRGEVMLAAGAIGSPQLLQLSRHRSGRAARSGTASRSCTICRASATICRTICRSAPSSRSPARDAQRAAPATCSARRRSALEYALRRTGPMSMAPSQLGIFMRSDARLRRRISNSTSSRCQPRRLRRAAARLPRLHRLGLQPAAAQPGRCDCSAPIPPRRRRSGPTICRPRPTGRGAGSHRAHPPHLAAPGLAGYRPEEFRPGADD